MALTVRQNGTGASNLIQAQWFNDYHDLLTGVMADQPVTVNNMLLLKQTTYTTPTAPTVAAVTAASGVDVGSHVYAITFGMGYSQTLPGSTASITVASGSQQVDISNIPLGPAGTTYRAVYRSKAGTTTPLYLVTTINDNTTTTYNDTATDASLTTVAASHDTFGGQLLLQNQSGTNKAQIRADGSVWFDGGSMFSDGAGNLTVTSINMGGGSATFGNTQVNGTLGVTGNVTLTGGNLSTPAGKGVSFDGGGLQSDGAGNFFLKNAKSIVFQNSSAGNVNVVNVDASNNLNLASTGGNINFIGSGGATIASMATSGITSGAGFGFGAGVSNFYSSGADVYLKTGGNTNGIHFTQYNGNAYFVAGGTVGLGIKANDGSTKLFEVSQAGVVNAKGAAAWGQGTSGFDSFDYAETFYTDADYAFGTILCPASVTTPFPTDDILSFNPTLTKCTHDGCSLAMAVSKAPGSWSGVINSSYWPDTYVSTDPLQLPLTQVGRIYVNTAAASITPKSYVCSDGNGGVRAVVAGDKVHALGVTLAPVANGIVPIVYRPTFVSL